MAIQSFLTFMIQIRYTNTSPRRRLTFLSFRTFRMQQCRIQFGAGIVHATEQTARKLCQRIVRARICMPRTIAPQPSAGSTYRYTASHKAATARGKASHASPPSMEIKTILSVSACPAPSLHAETDGTGNPHQTHVIRHDRLNGCGHTPRPPRSPANSDLPVSRKHNTLFQRKR